MLKHYEQTIIMLKKDMNIWKIAITYKVCFVKIFELRGFHIISINTVLCIVHFIMNFMHMSLFHVNLFFLNRWFLWKTMNIVLIFNSNIKSNFPKTETVSKQKYIFLVLVYHNRKNAQLFRSNIQSNKNDNGIGLWIKLILIKFMF